MIIDKVLNNNVAVIKDKNNQERIVMGRGLTFQKKIGDEIEADKVDKVFLLTNPDTNRKLQELLADIPMEYVTLAQDIITYIKTELGKKLNDTIHIALIDHIYTAIIRFQEGIVIRNALLWDIRRFYKDEYAIAMHALDMIEEAFGVRLPDDEAGFIALHITNAQLEEQLKDVYEITKLMQELSNIVKYYFNIEFDEDSVYYYRFVTHLKFFAQRIIDENTHQKEENDLLDIIKAKYRNSYYCTERINEFITNKYGYTVSDEEKMYLTIHIEQVVYKGKRK